MNIFDAAFRIGRLWGIDIRIHVLFVIFIVFELVGAKDLKWELSFYTMLFTIVLVHEFGHCFGARSVGGDARDILMWPLGGLAFAQAPMRPWPQFVTVACGPLVNVIFALVSGLLLLAMGAARLGGSFPFLVATPAGEAGLYIYVFYYVNMWLLAFNLLPIYPLDGGQLFHTIIWPFVGLRRATEIACYVGLVGCAGLMMWALSGAGGILFFIAIFGGFTCWQRLQAARYGMLFDERVATYDHVARYTRRRSLWSRLFGRRTARVADPEEDNPNPGGWDRRQQEERRVQQEVDRILKKVHEHGMHSLSYVERQTLERATRDLNR